MVKNINKPVLLHVITKKGFGYEPAENDETANRISRRDPCGGTAYRHLSGGAGLRRGKGRGQSGYGKSGADHKFSGIRGHGSE